MWVCVGGFAFLRHGRERESACFKHELLIGGTLKTPPRVYVQMAKMA